MAALSPEQGRAVTALADVAWAYGEAMARGDTARASQLLALFQSLYSGYRAAVLAGYPETQQAAVDAVLPRALAVDGVYGPKTKLGMMAALGVAFGNAARAPLSTMPDIASKFGAWFTGTLKPIAPAFGTVWKRAQELAPMDLAATLGGELEAYILALEEPPPAETSRLPDATMFSWTATHANFQRTMNAPAPTVPSAAQTLVQNVPSVPARRFRMPTWGWAAIATVGVAGVGFAVWRATR